MKDTYNTVNLFLFILNIPVLIPTYERVQIQLNLVQFVSCKIWEKVGQGGNVQIPAYYAKIKRLDRIKCLIFIAYKNKIKSAYYIDETKKNINCKFNNIPRLKDL